ncbi:UNVERIFIED_CONTAM: T9SS type A sorting domain-containing protein [Prevotella sp. 15_C9]
MTRKVPILLLTLLLSLSTQAKVTNIIVWLTSGETVTYSLAEHPKVIPGSEEVKITTTKSEIVYNAGEVKKITFDDPASIEQKVADSANETVRFYGNAMHLSGFKAGESVRVFDTSGKLCYSYQTDNVGGLTIRLDNFQKGIYIVKTNRYSSKFIKK